MKNNYIFRLMYVLFYICFSFKVIFLEAFKSCLVKEFVIYSNTDAKFYSY